MPILIYYISQVIAQERCNTFISKMWRFIFSKIFSILRNILPWHSKKKIVHILFYVFRTKLNKAVNIFCRLPKGIRNVQMIPGFSTRLGWERGWKSCMANWKGWRSENVNAIKLNCKVVKKWQPPHFYINSPFSGLSPPLSSRKFRTRPCDSIFGRSYPLQLWYQCLCKSLCNI